jgi:glycosyltransferase involved in cell wall biosynthesis
MIDAMQYVKSPLTLKIAGTGEDEGFFRRRAANHPKVEFLGKIPDDELIDLYANTLAVPFVPINEDFGYVTLEAFKSCKPIITCTDSGEPTFFVKDGYNGLVCDPDPRAIAQKIDDLFQNQHKATEMGQNGYATTNNINWTTIATTLIDALRTDCD